MLQHQQATFFKPKSTTSSSSKKFFQEASAVATNTFRETEAAVKNFEENIKSKAGFFYLPQLDYSIADGIAPVISKTQAKLIYEVHHRGIVDRLNKLTLGTIYEGHPLDAVILHTAFDAENAAIHTAACEHWNQTFAWRSMIPFGAAPSAKLRELLTTSTVKQQSAPCPMDIRADNIQERAMALASVRANALPGNAGFDVVKKMLADACRDAAASGGGWVFLVASQSGLAFEVIRYRPGTSPLTSHLMPLVCINMQLYARIADYTDESAVNAYIEKSILAINWQLAEKNWSKSMHDTD